MKKKWGIFDQILWLYSLLATIFYILVFLSVVLNPSPGASTNSEISMGGIIFVVSLIPVLLFLIREGYFHFKYSK